MLNYDPLSRHSPRLLKGSYAFNGLFGGGSQAQPQIQDLTQVLEQIYQGTANTAGPNASLYSAVSPIYGQAGLTNQQQQMFGYTNTPNGYSVNSAPGGFLGAPQQSNPYDAGQPVVGPQSGGAPGASLPLNLGTSTSGYTSPSTLPGPAQGDKIGFGHTFNDPYAGYPSPSQSPDYHPGTLDLQTSGLNAYGPAATGALLNSNPFLADALMGQNANLANAFNTSLDSPILDKLKANAMGLDLTGAQSDAQNRATDQAALAFYGPAGTSHSNSALANDLFARNNAVQAQQERNYGLLSGVQGLDFQQQGLGLQQQGLLGNLSSQAANTASSSITNPILQLLFGFSQPGATAGANIDANNALTGASNALGGQIAGFNANATSAANIANANASAAGTSNMWSLISSLLSDKRIKKNVKKVGTSPSGTPEYEWEYKTDKKKRRYHGTTAQALEKLNPYAVIEDPISGMKAVNYAATDVPFYEVNPYKEAA